MPGHRQSGPRQPERRRRRRPTRSSVRRHDDRHARPTCARCSTPPTGRTRRSTPSIRAASPCSSTTSTKASACTQDRDDLNATLDTLRVLADNTDGRAIVNRNDLAAGMKQIIRDSSGYYLLGYNSTQAPTDGKFHEIKVSVKRRGVDVRARKGYWALTAEDVARASGAAEARSADGRDRGAELDRRAGARPSGAVLDRHGARRERQDPRDVRLGSIAPPPGPARGRAGRARRADGQRRRWPAVFRGRVPEDGAPARRRPGASAPAAGAAAAAPEGGSERSTRRPVSCNCGWSSKDARGR